MTVTVTIRHGHLDHMPRCEHGRIEGYCSQCDKTPSTMTPKADNASGFEGDTAEVTKDVVGSGSYYQPESIAIAQPIDPDIAMMDAELVWLEGLASENGKIRCNICREYLCDHTDFDWRNASAAGVTPSTTPATFSETDPAKAWVGEIENTVHEAQCD